MIDYEIKIIDEGNFKMKSISIIEDPNSDEPLCLTLDISFDRINKGEMIRISKFNDDFLWALYKALSKHFGERA